MSAESSVSQEPVCPPYGPKAVANFFLGKDLSITQMKLHKLLYYAHGWHLALRDRPLLDEMIEAWQYGPVVPSIYREFRDVGAAGINRFATVFNPETYENDVPQVCSSDESTIRLLERIWEVYSKFTAGQLSQMTHASGSPWLKTVERPENQGIRGVNISNDRIKEYFQSKLRAKDDAE